MRGNGIFIGVGLVVALFAVMVGITLYGTFNDHDVTVTVDSLERVENSDGTGAKYLVFAEDKVYQVTDVLLRGKFDSSDRYNELTEGITYDCTAIGFRFGLFSWYENLIDCEPVS